MKKHKTLVAVWLLVGLLAGLTLTVPAAGALDVCTNCTVAISWAVGEIQGVMPTDFTTEPLEVDWNVNEIEYIWLGLNCSTTLDDLFIVFETGGDVLEVVRTTPPAGWPSLVTYRSDFELGAYVYGPAGGFQLSSGQTSAEFTVMPTVTGCRDLKVYIIRDEQPFQEL